ncbi:L protein [Eelpout rhabdovirus]|uniref:Replicase n=1 Tax=Eelpout rhabdovirus TaxID=1736767 RepID=A0AAC8WAN6_9RHAB|nr:L protein [Eelpout rhabdovirus]ALJ30354.1 L protein [Eelpout rhabdovirus]
MDYSDEYAEGFNDPFLEDEFSSNFSDFFEKGVPLNQKDYNLNSPLIGDEIDAFLRYVRYRAVDLRFQSHTIKWKSYLEHFNTGVNYIQDHTAIHQWIGKHFLSIQTTQEYEDFLTGVNALTEAPDQVLTAFLSGWDQSTTGPTRKDFDQLRGKGLQYGAGFYNWHKITLMMNSQSKLERENLVSSAFQGFKPLSESETYWVYQLEDPSIGTWTVTENLAWSDENGVVLDKNTVMMIKDTFIGRIQTLLSLTSREDKKFPEETRETLFRLYQLGDEMLRESGDDAYEAIKMLEPMCNLRLSQLAHEYRPLIPDFPHFEHHVRTTCEELAKKHPLVLVILDLILSTKNVEEVLLYFGSFRHWGHPFIDYFEGLKKLHKQVTLPKVIDDNYAQALASDLAYIVLKKEFEKKKHWAVDGDLMMDNHPFKKHISEHTWPTPKQIEDFGDSWHHLPLTKVFDIPDVIDPSVIYSDKSHSMQRSEVLSSIITTPNKPIPTRKVLSSLLDKPATDWPRFLNEVDKVGLDREDLVIGLKGKERELKKAGRFFSLMSWRLREYFVMTEYLIKHHFVPLFKGLTMADDMTQVVKKMLERSQGQGEIGYERVSIANHIDYEKWNNHQRLQSNGPAFRVMGQFLGYPSLIEKTHHFFENSLIYYNGRPDLMKVTGEDVQNATEKRVCWQGQQGGLEGLRQKGWSILNLLIIRRESKIRNTRVQTLAQGDNQVICTQYRISPSRDDVELRQKLNHIKENNQVIMNAIEAGTNKLGLIINNDETIQSADFLTYGKIPIFRGNIRCLEGKRWSRVTCVTNDQLPNLSNVMSSVSTNALTVSHYDISPKDAMRQYCFFGCLSLKLVSQHNPALRGSHASKLNLELDQPESVAAVLFLDPSLGGACGMSLTRFLMRMFPDPVTEGLAFWKTVHENSTVPWLLQLCVRAGHPDIAQGGLDSISKLIENPAALNLRKETSAISVIKNEVKKFLYQKSGEFNNRMIATAIEQTREEEPYLDLFLSSITPLFPRFLSEFKSASFLGITDSLVSLFQNSKTIRGVFRNKFAREVEQKVLSCEINSLRTLGNVLDDLRGYMWKCSSLHAKELRRESWGMHVHGATIPHPLEMIRLKDFGHSCDKQDYVTVSVVEPLSQCLESKGRLPAYLGSKTSETTSIIQPWDRETNVPMIRRAAKLRDAISWFVTPGSNLAKSIINNIEGLTGEDWGGSLDGFKRTGSALHRFSSARVSSGGFAAQSPAKLTRMMSTTDTFRDIGSDNYDFMFQSLLIYSQITTGEILGDTEQTGTLHFHLHCDSCLSKIEEVTLDSTMLYQPEDRSEILSKWKPEGSDWSQERERPVLQAASLSDYPNAVIHYNIGRAQGFLYGDQKMTGGGGDNSSLFPLSLQYKVKADVFFRGLLDGLVYASSLATIHRRNFDHPTKFQATQYGTLEFLVESLTEHPPFLNLVRSGPLSTILTSVPHGIPPSYPMNNKDLGVLARNYLRYMLQSLKTSHSRRDYDTRIIIFADMLSGSVIYPYVLAQECANLAFKATWTKKESEALRTLRETAASMRSNPDFKMPLPNRIRSVEHEIRHASKQVFEASDEEIESLYWGREAIGGITDSDVILSSEKKAQVKEEVPKHKDPLISGLRSFQMATGSHYKMRSILTGHQVKYRDFICGGDGSGGLTSCLLRQSKHSKGLFNSLLEIKDTDLRGSSPSPPSAVQHLGSEKARCINLGTAWENPSDLSQQVTWDYFKKEIRENALMIDLLVLDMEVKQVQISEEIESCIEENLDILRPNGVIIYKTYLDRFNKGELTIVDRLSKYFSKVHLTSTDFTSGHSSEVYVLLKGKRNSPRSVKFIDWPMTWELSKVHKCWRSNKEELERAKQLQRIDMYQGVPEKLVSDWENDLLTITLSLGVESGIASVLCSYLSCHKTVYAASTLLAIWTHVTLYQIRPGSAPPSISRCQNIAVVSTCLMFALSLSRMDLDLYGLAKRILDNMFPLFYEKGRWNTKGGLNRSIRLDNKMATLGKILRVFSRLGLRDDVNWTQCFLSSQLMARGCDLKWLRRETGIPQLMRGDWTNKLNVMSEEWVKSESAWTD